MELLSTLRRIRACEGEAAAQLLLESYVAQAVAAERERCAKIAEEYDPGVSYFIRAALAEEIRRA